MIAGGDIAHSGSLAPTSVAPCSCLGARTCFPRWTRCRCSRYPLKRAALAWEVALSPADGLPSVCVAKPEWIRIVERAYLGPWVATLPEERWPEIRAALLDVLGFEP